MYTVTFYSYRGGVGRTTALANVAIDLALRGRKVLLVDFDLEAPSLPSFVHLRPKDGAHPGLVEFIAEYLRSGKSPDICNYVYPAKPLDKDCAEIWVMPAGRGGVDYWQAFHGINWKELYGLRDGFVLFEDIKFQWQEFLHPDYVLIDARAGINDRLAICTRQLPDALVTMLTPDSGGEAGASDKAGLEQVLRDVMMKPPPGLRTTDDVIFVASKVHPDFDGEDLELAVPCHEEVSIGLFPRVTIPHAPELLLEQQIIPNPSPRKRLSRAYRDLANALIRSNCTCERDGARAFLRELQQHPIWAVGLRKWKLPDIPDVLDLETRWYSKGIGGDVQLDQVIKNFDRDPDILAQAASCLFLAERYDRAMETLDQAIDRAFELNHPLDSLLWQRASYRRRLQLPGAVDDLLRLLEVPAPPKTRHFEPEDAGSPESDTTPLDTADPLTPDFPDIDRYAASAFQQLRRLDPDRIQEAMKKPRIQQLSPDAQQALIADVPFIRRNPLSEVQKQDPGYLFRARRWRDLIALLETRVAQPSSTSLADLFYLAMAYWGDGNEARATEVCHGFRELMLKARDPASMAQNLGASALQEIPLMSLMFWRAGDAITARKLLDRCDELLAEVSGDDFFSYWRFHPVNRDQFQEDCESLRKMIEDKACIRPFFLGREPG
jgi:MinD-like ATPase involved in chromosome partitioning or flagellar assembly